MSNLRFYKGQALGNDYLVVDAAELDIEMSPAQAVLLCDRHHGAGSDGLLIGELDRSPVRLRILNPDGSWAEKSGNGLRIFGAFLFHRGVVRMHEWFDVELPRDTVSMRIEDRLDAGAVMIRARMGEARFEGALIGFGPEPGETLGHELPLPRGGTAAVNTVYLGNPHCVVFVDELDRADFLDRAPQLCTHDAFEAGTNVQFARVIGPNEIEAWIWERGAGETLASGSSACAVAAAAVRRGFVQPGQFIVQMQGGEAEITVSPDYQLELLGPAQMVYEARTLY
jgi:diaminopimelate epimerase